MFTYHYRGANPVNTKKKIYGEKVTLENHFCVNIETVDRINKKKHKYLATTCLQRSLEFFVKRTFFLQVKS